ncbi:MAG: 50S ribosomal protein L22, partial [Candidatus Eremiobacteraeota bacterium]|nr:50S ribosomal protein L22 [Candidatus Eremiobacteraeota bacterium]
MAKEKTRQIDEESLEDIEPVREVRARARFVRMAPRKLRLVIDAIRGKGVNEARSILKFSGKRAADILMKLLNSAVANAENNYHMDADELYICKAYV